MKIAKEYDLPIFTSSHYYYHTNKGWKIEGTLAVDPFFSVAWARAYKHELKNVDDYYFTAGRYALEDGCNGIAEKIIQFYASKVEVQTSKLNNKQVKNRFDGTFNLKQQVKV